MAPSHSPRDPFTWCGSIVLIEGIGPSGPGPSGNCGHRAAWGSGRPPPAGSPSGEAHRSPLTLALLAPGPMGFMMVYMFSLELVESGGTAGAAWVWVCGLGNPHTPTRMLLTPRAGHDGCSRGAAASCRSLNEDMGTVRQGFSSQYPAGPAAAHPRDSPCSCLEMRKSTGPGNRQGQL